MNALLKQQQTYKQKQKNATLASIHPGGKELAAGGARPGAAANKYS